jgi:hypothetical protein
MPRGTFSTAGLGVGSQTVTATVYNDAGLSTTTSATVAIQAAPVAPPPVVPQVHMFFAARSVRNHSSELRLTSVTILGTAPGEIVRVRCEHCYGVSGLGPVKAKGNEVALPASGLVVTNRSRMLVYVTGLDTTADYRRSQKLR